MSKIIKTNNAYPSRQIYDWSRLTTTTTTTTLAPPTAPKTTAQITIAPARVPQTVTTNNISITNTNSATTNNSTTKHSITPTLRRSKNNGKNLNHPPSSPNVNSVTVIGWVKTQKTGFEKIHPRTSVDNRSSSSSTLDGWKTKLVYRKILMEKSGPCHAIPQPATYLPLDGRENEIRMRLKTEKEMGMPCQCDQIGLFLKFFGDKFSCKSSLTI